MDDSKKSCETCLHTNCMFYGEKRPPVYSGFAGQVNCWDNAYQSLGNITANAKGANA